jgi:hypothetical protein
MNYFEVQAKQGLKLSKEVLQKKKIQYVKRKKEGTNLWAARLVLCLLLTWGCLWGLVSKTRRVGMG